VPVRLLNLVVLGPQVAGSRDEVDVVVGVIILLELDRRQLEPGKRLGLRQVVDKVLQLRLVVESGGPGIRILDGLANWHFN
jgi:hypothetical protein